jgi:hypothetical protein
MNEEPTMFPIEDKPGPRRIPTTWRVLHKSYRMHLTPTSRTPTRRAEFVRAAAESWQTVDVGPWAKIAFSAAFLCPLLYPAAFALAFPMGSLCALILGINHVYRHLEDPPVWTSGPPAGVSASSSPYDQWVSEGQGTQRAVEEALAGLPGGMRRTFWPLTQQSEDLVLSLQRLALRARQIDAYLNSDSTAGLRERVNQTRALYERAEDPLVREHLRQADLSLQSALRDQEEMRMLLERMTAQAAHVNAALHHVLSQLVKQRLTGSEGAWRDYQAAAERLKALRYQIDAVEQVIFEDPFAAGEE